MPARQSSRVVTVPSDNDTAERKVGSIEKKKKIKKSFADANKFRIVPSLQLEGKDSGDK
jgi:hypothetical protein